MHAVSVNRAEQAQALRAEASEPDADQAGQDAATGGNAELRGGEWAGTPQLTAAAAAAAADCPALPTSPCRLSCPPLDQARHQGPEKPMPAEFSRRKALALDHIYDGTAAALRPPTTSAAADLLAVWLPRLSLHCLGLPCLGQPCLGLPLPCPASALPLPCLPTLPLPLPCLCPASASALPACRGVHLHRVPRERSGRPLPDALQQRAARDGRRRAHLHQ